jgi:hypothetical protein
VLHIAETGQRLIAYCAVPGSATEAAFAQTGRPRPAAGLGFGKPADTRGPVIAGRRAGPQVRHAHETPLQLKGCVRERACGAHMTPPRC